MVRIEVDGKEVLIPKGSMVIEATDKAGNHVPRFCYHKNLSIAACCRMCLVEIEKMPKPMPACATPVSDGMKVWTKSAKTLDAQKTVMEFLLINHPLDCPVCDQGGECELQDISVGYGECNSQFSDAKRIVHDSNVDVGPLISTEMNRCILCTRCIRFCEELGGVRELGIVGRGLHSRVTTFVKQVISSEVSGNIIDLCPVGALTAKPSRFKVREWELEKHPTISPHDCVGSNLFAHTKNGKLMRIVSRENDKINECWISDRDRFSYEGLYSKDRLVEPMIKKDNVWSNVSWEEALQATLSGIKGIIKSSSANNIGVIASPNSTLEEFYLLQKLFRGFGTNNIDHRIRQTDFRDQERFPISLGSDLSIQDIDKQDNILLIGSHINKEQPIVGLKLFKLTRSGGTINVINPLDFNFPFTTYNNIIKTEDYIKVLSGMAKFALHKVGWNKIDGKFSSLLTSAVTTEADEKIVNDLLDSKNVSIVLGGIAISHPDFSKILSLSKLIANLTESKFAVLTDGSNSSGAWLSGCIPHREAGSNTIESPGLSVSEMFSKVGGGLMGYFLLGLEAEFDSIYSQESIELLKKAEVVVAMSSFKSDVLLETTNILLPISPFYETSGTFVNTNGYLQSFSSVAKSLGSSRPAWKVLRALGSIASIRGFINRSFSYMSSAEVLKELEEILLSKDIGVKQVDMSWKGWALSDLYSNCNGKTFNYKYGNLYSNDPLVRRAEALQKVESV